jgi:zinc D-Ala-D-Ala carboxypeptidase
MIQTKNFNPKTDPKLLCTCGHDLCDQRSVSQEHLNRVQLVRNSEGALPVRSGGRCPHHPDEIHRTTPADHQNCVGIDVACNGSNRGNIMIAAYKAGCNAFGVAHGFIHLGYRADTPAFHTTMWVY